MPGWVLVLLENGKRQHVVPLEDLVHHEESGTCVCLPRAERHVTDDGRPFTQWVHSALDGRDL